MGNREPEQVIVYNQARLSVEALERQPSHKTFNLQFVLPARGAGVKEAQTLWEWPGNDSSSLRSMPPEGTHSWHCPEGQEPEVR